MFCRIAGHRTVTAQCHTWFAHAAVIDVSNSVLYLVNDMFTVPLIRRFSSQNILRTLHSVTVEPYHEIRLPVRLSPKYRLRPSFRCR